MFLVGLLNLCYYVALSRCHLCCWMCQLSCCWLWDVQRRKSWNWACCHRWQHPRPQWLKAPRLLWWLWADLAQALSALLGTTWSRRASCRSRFSSFCSTSLHCSWRFPGRKIIDQSIILEEKVWSWPLCLRLASWSWSFAGGQHCNKTLSLPYLGPTLSPKVHLKEYKKSVETLPMNSHKTKILREPRKSALFLIALFLSSRWR